MSTEIVKLSGFKELDEALSELSKTTAKNVAKRALTKGAKRFQAKAQSLAPKKLGNLSKKIIVGTKAKGGNAGQTAFHEAMAGGGSRAEAASAAREANAADPTAGDAKIFVGVSGSARKYGHIIEFGSSLIHPQPYMRPAWDGEKDAILAGIKDDLWAEIEKAAARAARKAAKA